MTSISESALVKRLRRRHRRAGETFHITRPSWYSNLGRWHIVDGRNYLTDYWHSLDELEAHARATHVLAANETIA